MNIKQRICGFFGHKSDALIAKRCGSVSHIKLSCTRCDYKTKWFRVDEADFKIMPIQQDAKL